MPRPGERRRRSAGSLQQSGGNMEGKETRFGIANSALWACATTAASNGSVNSMHDSFTPLGGLVPMWLMQLGEVVFGGVGSGLYGMLVFAIIAVFVAGLMVGRTPEYLGKKIEAFEMKMASLVILIPPLVVLVGTALAVSGPGLESATAKPAVSEQSAQQPRAARVLRSSCTPFPSAGNNNGSAFAGLTANVPFYNIAWDRDARRPLLADHSDAGDRRLAGAEEVHAAECRHVADPHAAVRGPAGRHGAAGRRVDVCARAGPGADRRAPADGLDPESHGDGVTCDDGCHRNRVALFDPPICAARRCSTRSASSIRGSRSAIR